MPPPTHRPLVLTALVLALAAGCEGSIDGRPEPGPAPTAGGTAMGGGPSGGGAPVPMRCEPGTHEVTKLLRLSNHEYRAMASDVLGLSLEQRYETLRHATHKAWNWSRGEANGGSFTSTSPDLARALRRNPHLRVFVASGRYDLGTPYSASDWSLAQLDVDAGVRARITHRHYDAGHMMYTREPDLLRLESDLAGWIG